ncbi:MAG: response regulator [Ignavibacteriota bacterium]
MADDDPGIKLMLEIQIRDLSIPCQLEWAQDGQALLDVLAAKTFARAPLPSLILMDLNMPRKDGLQTLRAIKNDTQWRVIPVIVFSTRASAEEVRKAYDAGASCYVQKPEDLNEWERFVRALTMFWADFATYSAPAGAMRAVALTKGMPLALGRAEVSRRVMTDSESRTLGTSTPGPGSGCQERCRLMENLARTVKELLGLHEDQFRAIVQGDPECSRFDLLIHMANEKKQQAKYAFVRHVESHGCLDANGSYDTGTGSDYR